MTVVTDTTTNNALPYPTAGNDGTDFSTGLAEFAAAVDKFWAAGTFASRPASAPTNAFYYATDVNLVYQYSGSRWNVTLIAGPWTNLTVASGWHASGGARYRIEGDLLRQDGIVQNTSGSTQTSGTILTGYPNVTPDTFGFLATVVDPGGNVLTPVGLGIDLAHGFTNMTIGTGSVPPGAFVYLTNFVFPLTLPD